MPERTFAVDAPDGREAQATETGNQPGRLRLIRVVGIGSAGRKCERMRSHARMLNASRAPDPYNGPTRNAENDSAARGCARLIPDAFPACLRGVDEHDLERRVRTSTPESQLHTPGGSQGRTAPRNDMGPDEHPPPLPPGEWRLGECAAGRWSVA